MSDDARGGGGDDVTTGVEKADTADPRALLEQAEAEAAEAEAAAAEARARVRAMRSQEEGAETVSKLAWWPAVAKALATLVIVACLGGSGYILWNHHQASVRDDRAADFVAAASRGITAMTSLDFRHAKEDVQRIIDNSTGSLRDDYTARARDFENVVEQSKVIAHGTVTATAVKSMSKDEAVVLVTASQDVSNAAGNKAPRTYRFRVTVTRDDGQLKMSKAEFVP